MVEFTRGYLNTTLASIAQGGLTCAMRSGVAGGILFSGLVLLSVWARGTDKIKFIENRCQWDERIQYVASVSGGAMQLQADGFAYLMLDKQQIEELHHSAHEEHEPVGNPEIAAHYFKVQFIQANTQAVQIPVGKQTEYYNYFIGSNPSNWSSQVPAYSGVVYENFYPGINLIVYGSGASVKYDFHVAAEGDPDQIQFEYQGADRLFLDHGDLVVQGSHFTFREKSPLAYQVKDGQKVYVRCQFVQDKNRIRFQFPDSYDPCYPLIIDPLLIFSTYSGSTADNWGSTATPGENGRLYSSGVTNHYLGGTFPATAGAFQVNYGGLFDVSILKYDSTGKTLLYASYLGGSGNESPHSLIMAEDQSLYVLGTTGSGNFPTSVNAFDRSFNGGTYDYNVFDYSNGSDIYIARISPNGSSLLASTYLGGSANDGLNPNNSELVANYGDELRGDILIDPQGNVIISSVTASPDFPVRNAVELTYQGGQTDALVARLTSDLSEVTWATFLGGSAADASHTVKLDSQGDVYVGGGTTSVDFPSFASAYQPNHAGWVDGWIAKLKQDGSALEKATFTGTVGFNQVYFIDLDQDNNVYVYGQTTGTFPVTTGVYSNANSGQFLQKFDPDLTTLAYSTVFGAGRGIPDISPTAFLVNDCNNIYMSGWGGAINRSRGFWNSGTIGMPVTFDAYQQETAGSDFYFIVLTSDASELLYATFLGGKQSPTHVDGGTSRFDKGGIVYHSVCGGCGGGFDDFPTTPGAWSQLNRSVNCNNAAFKFDLSSLKARIQTNSIDLDMPGLNRVCLPDPIVFQNLSTGGQFYEWDFGDGGQLVRQDTSYVMHAYASPGTYRIKLLVIDAGTCVGKDSTFTTVTVSKPGGFAGPDQEMCFDAGTRLVASGGVTYKWENWDKSFQSAEASPYINPKEDDGYVVTITDFNGCSVKDTTQVRVIPGIELQFDYSKMYDCDTRPVLRVENLSDPEEETFIDFGDGTTSDLTTTSHSYQTDGTYALRVVGIKESCFYDKRVDVPIYQLKVPNVITPDEFPENNQFVILYGNQPLSLSALNAHVVIYNRWGNKVFESRDYQDDWSASNVEAGIYYYDVEVEGEAACKGWLQVIK